MQLPSSFDLHWDIKTIDGLKKNVIEYNDVSFFIALLIDFVESLQARIEELETRQDPEKYNV